MIKYMKGVTLMCKYAILANPGHNRIYFDTAMKIAYSELKAITKSRGIELKIYEEDLGLPASICFKTNRKLEEEDFKALSVSSIYYAIFEILEDNLLRAITPVEYNTFPESLNQILKYNGKTNEQFTRLMVNLAISACETNSEKICLIDPMCGKGTTLYEGIIRGFDVFGVEINSQWTQEIYTYLLRYLKTGKYKHKSEKGKQSSPKGKKIAEYFKVITACTKELYNKKCMQNINVFNSDTRNTGILIKKESCDILVSDLPYGVQHGSKNEKDSNLNRSPLDLLKDCIPSWKKVIKVGGSVVISFNEFTLKYSDVEKVFESNGFKVLNEDPYINYIHRVDQSINRNLIVAVKIK